MSSEPQLLLETVHLSKSFGRLKAVYDLNLHVYEGDIYVLLGPNGAGKTTTLGLIAGLLHPTSGRVDFAGKTRKLAGFIGSPPLYPHLSGEDNLGLSFLMRRLPVDRVKIQSVLNMAGLEEAGRRKAGEYSTGMRQRLAIARALLFEPRLIILDEPTSGLDPEGIVEIRELILRLNRETGLTWLISSHILAEVELVATRVSILMHGEQKVEAEIGSLREADDLVALEAIDLEMLAQSLPEGATPLRVEAGRLIVRLNGLMGPAELNKFLMEKGIPVTGLMRVTSSLEDVYFQICHGATGDMR